MSRVKYLAPDTDAYVASVERHVDEFTRETGIDVDIEIMASDEYFENRITAQLNADDPADVYMSGPVLLWEHVARGNVEPLDDYVASSSPGWDASDFLPTVMAANRWTGRFGDPLGSGPLLEIPVNCESYNLAYLPEHLRTYGVAMPRTWAEYFVAAGQIAERSGGVVAGFAQRGVDVWHTMYTGYATQVWSYGGRDFDDQGRCVIDSPEVVKATQDFIDALRASGPSDWTNRRWYELALDFANGKYGLIVDSDHYVAIFEDPSLSSKTGEIAYALPPAGPTGLRKPNLWTWSLVMNAASRRKAEAWRFIEWASSSAFLTRSAGEGNMNPTRRSTWESAEFAALSQGWGDYASVCRALLEEHASALITPATNYRAVADRWVQALLEAYRGDRSVPEALSAAARDIDGLVAR